MAATTADLTSYTDGARRAIEFEAETWLYGNVESARRSYDKTREWARILTPQQRYSHSWGAWYANQGLTRAAISEVQGERGDCRDCGNGPGEAHTADTIARHEVRGTDLCA